MINIYSVAVCRIGSNGSGESDDTSELVDAEVTWGGVVTDDVVRDGVVRCL